MRTIFILLFISIVFLQCTTTKIVKNNYPSPFVFSLIDTVPGTKNELYVKAHEWVAKTFTSAKDVIQMSDKEAGKLIVKAVYAVPGVKNGYGVSFGDDYIHYSLSIDVKEGRYKCVISDFYHESGNYQNSQHCNAGSLDNAKASCSWFTLNRWNYAKDKGMGDAEYSLKSLKKAMRSNSENW